MALWLERALFIVGPQDSGKSPQLRSLFLDRRLGTAGVIPATRNVAESYYIGKERKLRGVMSIHSHSSRDSHSQSYLALPILCLNLRGSESP